MRLRRDKEMGDAKPMYSWSNCILEWAWTASREDIGSSVSDTLESEGSGR
jgi:hypothetical protein